MVDAKRKCFEAALREIAAKRCEICNRALTATDKGCMNEADWKKCPHRNQHVLFNPARVAREALGLSDE